MKTHSYPSQKYLSEKQKSLLDDRHWFISHSARRFRLRLATAPEMFQFGAPMILIQSFMDGARMRVGFTPAQPSSANLDLDNIPEDRLEMLWSMMEECRPDVESLTEKFRGVRGTP